MVKWNLWSYVLILTTLAVSSSNLQTGLGMETARRPKRPLSELGEDERKMVTIDLSALRPSLPGLVLYKYGDAAPKLVQVDLSALNPQLQPHVIWPEFNQMDFLNDRTFEFDSLDAIPYLTDDESFIAPKQQRMDKMAQSMTDANSWSGAEGNFMDNRGNDIYDFIPSRRNDDLMSLQGSLPLAEEVIVPLDWEEEKTSQNSAKRNVFMSRGWKAGGQKGTEKSKDKNAGSSKTVKASQGSFNVHYTPFGTTNWIPGKRKPTRETESEEMKDDSRPASASQVGKKNAFVSNGWGPGGQQVSMAANRREGTGRKVDNKPPSQTLRVSSQESWSVPKQYWNVPHLIGGHWQ